MTVIRSRVSRSGTARVGASWAKLERGGGQRFHEPAVHRLTADLSHDVFEQRNELELVAIAIQDRSLYRARTDVIRRYSERTCDSSGPFPDGSMMTSAPP